MSEPTMELHRRYRFSAAHRLHVEAFSPAENRQMFGRCNNPFGHGHNYVVELTFAGPVERTTGMVANLADLDAFAQQQLEAFDCANLNQLPCFANKVPSTENLCAELWNRFRTFRQAQLKRVRVEETGNNTFEYSGEQETSFAPAALSSSHTQDEQR